MVKANRFISIPLDLSDKEWTFNNLADLSSTDYHPPKDFPTLPLYKHPDFPAYDFLSNGFSDGNGDNKDDIDVAQVGNTYNARF